MVELKNFKKSLQESYSLKFNNPGELKNYAEYLEELLTKILPKI